MQPQPSLLLNNPHNRKQQRNPAATQIQEIPDRGHSLVFDSGWQDVAETALAFIKANR